MPGKVVHTTAGVVFGFPAVLACRKAVGRAIDPVLEVGMLAASALGSAVPDKLEPANCPNHRGFWHSVAAGTGASMLVSECLHGIRSIAESETETRFYSSREEEYRKEVLFVLLCLLVAFLFGFLSHQALDGLTPASLPLLGM